MSMDNVPQGFSEIKPSPFPLNMDVRPVKLTQTDDPTEDFGVTFLNSQSLVQNYIDNIKYGPDGQPIQQSTTQSGQDPATVLSRSQGTRGMEGIYEGIGGFFSPLNLAQIEQVGDSSNFEDPKSASFTDMRQIFKNSPMFQADPNLQEQIFHSSLLDKARKTPGSGYTMPHNLSLLYGIGSDPFKKWDTKNKSTFDNSASYADLHGQSLSPRSILQQMDPGFWNSMNQFVGRVHAVHTANFSDRADASNSLNWTNVPEMFQDAQKKDANGNVSNTFDVGPNYYSIVTSQLWKTMTPADSFSFITLAAEAKTRAHNVLRQIMGPAKSLMDDSMLTPKAGVPPVPTVPAASAAAPDPNVVADPTVATTPATTPVGATATVTPTTTPPPLQDSAQETAAKQSNAIGRVDKWWTDVGSKLDEAQVFPYGLLADIAPAMESMMNWANWNTSSPSTPVSGAGATDATAAPAASATTDPAQDTTSQFREKMVSDYMNQLNQTYVPKFQGDQTVTLGALSKVTDTQGNAVFTALRNNGLINSSGQIQPSFDPNVTSLNLGLEPTLETKVLSYMKDTYRGNFSLDHQDSTGQMQDIRLKSIDGQYRSLDEVVGLLKSGATGLEKVTNAQIAYNYLMDLHSAMAGLSTTTSSNRNGMVAPMATGKDGTVQVSMSQDAQWTQSTDKGAAQVTGPLTMQFKNSAAAQGFQDSVQMMLSLLEPVVSTFGPSTLGGASVPFRTLVDNSLSLDSKGDPIQRGSEGYKMDVDVDFDSALFQQDTWTKVAGRLTDKVNNQIVVTLFSRTEFNSIQDNQHQTKVEQYQKDKDQAQLEQNAEDAATAQKKAEQAQLDAEQQAKNQAIQNEAAAADAQRQAQANADQQSSQSG